MLFDIFLIEEKILNKKKLAAFYFLRSLALTTDVLLRLRLRKSRGGSASQGTGMLVLLFSGKVMFRDVNYEFIQYRKKDKKKPAAFYFPAEEQYHRRKRA